MVRENGKGGMRKGGIGQVNRNTQQTSTNKLEFPIPPFLIPPFPISQLCNPPFPYSAFTIFHIDKCLV